jgi:hypothetical protein
MWARGALLLCWSSRAPEKLTILDDGDALAILDHESGKLLEHRQLRKDPHYKTVYSHTLEP